MSMKNCDDTINPTTFRLVAQCLNQLHHCGIYGVYGTFFVNTLKVNKEAIVHIGEWTLMVIIRNKETVNF
jgi:hypothetical protein